MLLFRSLLFNVAFYLHMIVWLFLLIPVAALPRLTFIRAVQVWARCCLWLLRVIAGTKVEFRGLEKIPPGGILVAAKHQSLWETFALLPLFSDPAFILKRELIWIPLFGWYAAKARCVPVDRRAGSKALVLMNVRARAEAEAGRQIVIFPEGTRRAPGAPPAYKFGVAHLYDDAEAALRAGGAEFRSLLAAPPRHPPPRHDPCRNPRSDPVRPVARRIFPRGPGQDRGCERAPLPRGPRRTRAAGRDVEQAACGLGRVSARRTRGPATA